MGTSNAGRKYKLWHLKYCYGRQQSSQDKQQSLWGLLHASLPQNTYFFSLHRVSEAARFLELLSTSQSLTFPVTGFTCFIKTQKQRWHLHPAVSSLRPVQTHSSLLSTQRRSFSAVTQLSWACTPRLALLPFHPNLSPLCHHSSLKADY